MPHCSVQSASLSWSDVVSLDWCGAQRTHLSGLVGLSFPAALSEKAYPAPPCGKQRKCYDQGLLFPQKSLFCLRGSSLYLCWVCLRRCLFQTVGRDRSSRDLHWFRPGWCSICSSWLPPLWDNKRTHAPITVSCVTHQSAVREGELVKNTVHTSRLHSHYCIFGYILMPKPLFLLNHSLFF